MPVGGGAGRAPSCPGAAGVTGGAKVAGPPSAAAGSTQREEGWPRFLRRTTGPAVFPVLGCRASQAAARRGLLGPPRRPGPRAAGACPERLARRELPCGRQQLVSPRGAAPPFPGTKAAARAGAPGRQTKRGARRGLRGVRPRDGTPSSWGALKLPTSPTRVSRCRAGRAARSERAREPRAARGRTRALRRGSRGNPRGRGARPERGGGRQRRRLGNLLQSSDS